MKLPNFIALAIKLISFLVLFDHSILVGCAQETTHHHPTTPQVSSSQKIKFRIFDLGSIKTQLPKNTQKEIQKKMRRGRLGLQCVEREMIYQNTRSLGLQITQVEAGGPADLGGLHQGDLLVKVNHRQISHAELYRSLSSYSQHEISFLYLPKAEFEQFKETGFQDDDLKKITIQYEQTHLFVSHLMNVIGHLEQHDIELYPLTSAEVKSLVKSLTPLFKPAFLIKNQLNCDNSGELIKQLIDQKTDEKQHEISRSTLLSSQDWELRQFNLRKGDIFVLEQGEETLLAMYGGTSFCVKYTDKSINRNMHYTTRELVNRLTLSYRLDEIKQAH